MPVSAGEMKLLPCPCCGAAAETLLRGHYFGHDPEQVEPIKAEAVLCPTCNARAPLNSWNGRAGRPPASALGAPSTSSREALVGVIARYFDEQEMDDDEVHASNIVHRLEKAGLIAAQAAAPGGEVVACSYCAGTGKVGRRHEPDWKLFDEPCLRCAAQPQADGVRNALAVAKQYDEWLAEAAENDGETRGMRSPQPSQLGAALLVLAAALKPSPTGDQAQTAQQPPLSEGK